MFVPQAFGSVIFLLGASGNGTKSPDLERGADWLGEWIAWFLQHNGILEGRNLHMLYDRSVAVLGRGALERRSEIGRLSAVAQEHGATFASELCLTDCLKAADAYAELIQQGLLKSIIFNPDGYHDEGGRALAVVEAAVRHGVAVILLGSPSFWDNAGVLESTVVNSSNFRIVPAGDLWNSETNVPTKLEDSDLARTELPITGAGTAWTFSPCDTKFAIYVTPDGELYPCLGLIGCEQWCMGSIDQRPEESRFATDEMLTVLSRWGGEGPDLGTMRTSTEHRTYLPRICSAHYQLLMRNKGT